jgi:hypothetical protein
VNHNLDEAERRDLIKLEFVSDETYVEMPHALPMSMWEWAWLDLIHRQRILVACAAPFTSV